MIIDISQVLPVSPHFMLSEFNCHHCGAVKLDQWMLSLLEGVRAYWGRPMVVLSGYRCPPYNAEIGGADASYHMEGMAADVQIAGVSIDEIAQAAVECGAGGVGRYYDSGFVHIDSGPRRDWAG